MGTLGQYLHDARIEKEIDLRDAAQQTRISIQYLKALENEDFTKLPGEVFVKGFLKNYGRFLKLNEEEILKRYSESKPKSTAVAVAPSDSDKIDETTESSRNDMPVEPFVWGAVITVLILVFLFSFPAGNSDDVAQTAIPVPDAVSAPSDTLNNQYGISEKVYLELIALEDTWLLVRTDGSPQKKAVLKKGENLLWSADERFVVSYGSAGGVKLVLNGEEITVNGPKEQVVRDLTVTRAGIVNQPAEPKQAMKPKPKPLSVPAEERPSVAEQKPASELNGSQPIAGPDEKPKPKPRSVPAEEVPSVAEQKPAGEPDGSQPVARQDEKPKPKPLAVPGEEKPSLAERKPANELNGSQPRVSPVDHLTAEQPSPIQ